MAAGQILGVTAANMPTRLMTGEDGSVIEHADYKRADFEGLADYNRFVGWIMQQLSHFASDSRTKRFLMAGQDLNEEAKFSKKALRPEPKKGESYREFVTQTSRLTQSQHAQLYCAFGLAQVYAHDQDCRMFFLDLDEKGRQLVKQTLYAPILDAFVLELEQEEKGAVEDSSNGVIQQGTLGKVDFIVELRTVQGVSFCCGADAEELEFAAAHF